MLTCLHFYAYLMIITTTFTKSSHGLVDEETKKWIIKRPDTKIDTPKISIRVNYSPLLLVIALSIFCLFSTFYLYWLIAILLFTAKASPQLV